MDVRELSIPGAWVVTPRIHEDDRGAFLESYRFEPWVERTGTMPVWKQGNVSVSRRGVLRGIHYAITPPGQAKYVQVAAGKALDVVIDLRVGSPTFGRWEAIELDTVVRRSVHLAEGLGHAFLALEDGTTLSYLCSEVFDPEREFTIDPFDPELRLEFPLPRTELVLSERDAAAPSLAEARSAGRLPVWGAK